MCTRHSAILSIRSFILEDPVSPACVPATSYSTSTYAGPVSVYSTVRALQATAVTVRAQVWWRLWSSRGSDVTLKYSKHAGLENPSIPKNAKSLARQQLGQLSDRPLPAHHPVQRKSPGPLCLGVQAPELVNATDCVRQAGDVLPELRDVTVRTQGVLPASPPELLGPPGGPVQRLHDLSDEPKSPSHTQNSEQEKKGGIPLQY